MRPRIHRTWETPGPQPRSNTPFFTGITISRWVIIRNRIFAYLWANVTFGFLLKDTFISGICWSILNGGNFYVDSLSTLVLLSWMLDYKSATWHLTIIFLQLTFIRQSWYTYFYDFLLEPLYFFNGFWSSAGWVCKLIAKKDWISEVYYPGKWSGIPDKERTDDALKRKQDEFFATRHAVFESWRLDKQMKYWKKAVRANMLRKYQEKDGPDTKSKGQQGQGHPRAESDAEKEIKEEARVMRERREAALDTEGRRTVQSLMKIHREHESQLSTANTKEYMAEVKDKFYNEMKALSHMLWDEIQQREAEAKESEERNRLKRARKKKRQEEEAELRAERDQEEQKEANRALVGEMYWEEVMDMQLVDRMRYGKVYQAFVKGCENLARSPDVFPPLGNYNCQKSKCTKAKKLAACRHDVEKTFRGSGQYSEEFLQQQRRTWHPDKFAGKGIFQIKAKELFQIIGQLKYGPDI